MFLQFLDKFYFPSSIDLYGLRYLRPFLIIVLILNNYLLSVQLVVSYYDLHPVQKDHNGNKRNHFLFFVCYPWYWLASHRTLQFVYFKCIFYVYV